MLKLFARFLGTKLPYFKGKDKIIAEIYYQKDLEWNKVMEEATIVTKPFFDPDRKRTTPAELY